MQVTPWFHQVLCLVHSSPSPPQAAFYNLALCSPFRLSYTHTQYNTVCMQPYRVMVMHVQCVKCLTRAAVHHHVHSHVCMHMPMCVSFTTFTRELLVSIVDQCRYHSNPQYLESSVRTSSGQWVAPLPLCPSESRKAS